MIHKIDFGELDGKLLGNTITAPNGTIMGLTPIGTSVKYYLQPKKIVHSKGRAINS